MMARNWKWLTISAGTLVVLAGFQNCGRMQGIQVQEASSNSESAVGDGGKYVGKGSLSVPTAEGVVARITNGLEGSVNPTAGNFARSLTAVKTNLPANTDPSKASGFDSVQMLVYAACTDLTTGANNSQMRVKYNVPTTGTVAANKAALVAAGVRMFDSHVAGLATQSTVTAQVNQVFSTLVDTIGATTTNTTQIAFVSVCIAANTAGSTLMGF